MPHASTAKRRQYWRDYYQAHRDEHLARNAAYRARHKTRLAKIRDARRATEPEVFREYDRRYRQRHRDELRARRLTTRHVRTTKADSKPAIAPICTRWTIVDDLGEREGIEYARCRCHLGHEAVIAVDVRPAPDCTECLRQKRRRKLG